MATATAPLSCVLGKIHIFGGTCEQSQAPILNELIGMTENKEAIEQGQREQGDR